MPTGQPDFGLSPQERSVHMNPSDVETYADRVIREAMESGEFADLPGQGKPIPGAGTVDDEMWWIRSWIERNRRPDQDDDQEPSKPS